MASLDGKTLIDVKNAKFTEAGRVGLVTKADAGAAFDDVKVRELCSEKPQP